jgi:4a-hydroxytetrahydrobiopterin dehydratase
MSRLMEARMETDLAARPCIPCRGGVPPLTAEQVEPLLAKLDGWAVEENKMLVKSYGFTNFINPVHFVNKITEVAEAEGHHPDLYVRWGEVSVFLWTHKIDGLTESDFYMAAKIDRVHDALPDDWKRPPSTPA